MSETLLSARGLALAWSHYVGDDPRRITEILRTAFASGDPITRGIDRAMQRVIPGAQGQPHTIVKGAGHFVQEDQGEALAEIILGFINKN